MNSALKTELFLLALTIDTLVDALHQEHVDFDQHEFSRWELEDWEFEVDLTIGEVPLQERVKDKTEARQRSDQNYNKWEKRYGSSGSYRRHSWKHYRESQYKG